MKDQKKLKHKVLEVTEGGLRGTPAARAFAWLLIVLITLSMVFLLLEKTGRMEELQGVFEVIETFAIGVFTLELLLGLWTADVRFPGDPNPRLHYLREPMTIIQILAILPFYMGLLLENTRFDELSEAFEFLKLLHLLKMGEIAVHSHKDKKTGSGE